MRSSRLVRVAALLTFAPALAGAQHPVGGEFQVNHYTTGDQFGAEVSPDGAGGFVVTWFSNGSSGTDTDARSIQARRFAADGTPVADQFQVNTYTTDKQSYSRVSEDGAGGFVVVWHSLGSAGTDTDGQSVQAQRYAGDGSPLGGEFQVNTYSTNNQEFAVAAPYGDGNFVIVWESLGSSGDDTSGWSIQAQRYDSDGQPIGGEFEVNDYTFGSQIHPAIAPDGAGGFVVAWTSALSGGTDDSSSSVQARRFGADGLPAGDQFQVNTYTTDAQREAAVGPDGADSWVIAWASDGSDGGDASESSIQAQRYGADGSPVGGQFQVNTYTTNVQTFPAVGSDGAGDFVVTWGSFGSAGSDTSAYSIQAQRHATDGAPLGGEFQVNTYTYLFQFAPAISPDGAGGFVVAWTSTGSGADDDDSRSIQAQRYVQPEIFADGFESGDTSAWSVTVP